MNLKKLILEKNECYLAGKTIKPTGIMVHSTGADNPMLHRYVGSDGGLLGKNIYNNHWNALHPGGRDIGPHTFINDGKNMCKTCGGKRICCHAFIGKLADGSVATYQILPWNHRGWHGGGTVNDTHIGFEICEDNLKDRAYFNAIWKEAVELCTYLCKEFNLDPMKDGVLIDHAEGARRGIATNHVDVGHWFPKHGKSMDSFRAAVKAELASIPAPVPTEDEPVPVPTDNKPVSPPPKNEPIPLPPEDEPGPKTTGGNHGFAPYQVKVTANLVHIRKSPGIFSPIVRTIKGQGIYTIVAESRALGASLWGKLKSGEGWISLDLTKKTQLAA